ncbi:MAG: Cupin protein [Candidatus Brocadiaceae bacterium]|nr:Cupin protein [Candidatus Brocadiaceae bacterium]
MRKIIAAIVLVLASLFGQALAQSTAPTPVLPQNLRWFSPPNNAALRGAWVLGADQKPGAYLLRVKLASGGKVRPIHTRTNATVPSFPARFTLGLERCLTNRKLLPFRLAASTSRLQICRTKDGEAMYQESGVGPTATVLVK